MTGDHDRSWPCKPQNPESKQTQLLTSCEGKIRPARISPFMSTSIHSDQTPTDRAALFLNVAETAALLRLSSVTLGRWRIAGVGPPYCKFGRRVVYSRTEVVTWAHAQKRQNTSVPVQP
jgi:hypothetical protein